MAGTNYNAKKNPNVNISLTNDQGYATTAECDGNPNAVALESEVYTNGCIMRRTDLGVGTVIYQNTGTLTTPSWAVMAGVGSMTIGAPVIGAAPNLYLYVDNLGNLYQDQLNSRDSITNETHIGLDDTVYTQQFSLLDITGGGNFGVIMTKNADNPLDLVSAVWGTVDGAILGSPDGAIAVGLFNDTTGNINAILIMDSTGIRIGHNDATSNTAGFLADANLATVMSFDDKNSANTFNNQFFITTPTLTTTGIGWADNFNSLPYHLPITPPTAGQALGSTAGLPTGGQLEWITPTGGGGVALGGAASAFTAGEIQYIKSDGVTQWGDTSFLRSDVDNSTAIYSSGIEAPYLIGYQMGGSLGNLLSLQYYDAGAAKGSKLLMNSTSLNSAVLDTAGGLLINTTSDTTTGRVGLEMLDSTNNKASVIGAIRATGVALIREYNDSGNLGNRVVLSDTKLTYNSDLVVVGSLYLSLNASNELYQMGDFGGVSNGMSLIIDNSTGAQVAGLGDVFAVNNGTAYIADDFNKILNGTTNASDRMFYVKGTSTSQTTFGFQAGNATITGTGDSLFGNQAGKAITSANDNSAFGQNALSTNTGGHSNTAIGSGALSTLNDSGISNAEYNTALGRSAGSALTTGSYNTFLGTLAGATTLTTGSYNILIGYQAGVSSATSISRVAIGFTAQATADYQVMFGGTGSPFNTFIIGGGDAISSANATDVNLRINNLTGTDVAGKDFYFTPSLATGNAATGALYFMSAIAGGTGTTLQTASKWGKIVPRQVHWGDIDGVGNNVKIQILDDSSSIQLDGNALLQSNSDRNFFNGSMQYKRTAVNDTDYTILDTDYLISMENLTASRTVTVPDASTSFAGRVYVIKDADGLAGTQNIILDPAGTDTIDDSATFTMNVNYQAITLISDGVSNWEIV